jgi:hypothetical protein
VEQRYCRETNDVETPGPAIDSSKGENMMQYVLALVATLALSGPAAAQHAHGAKGPNGGQLEDVAGVHAELLTSGNTITINVFDEGNKPVATRALPPRRSWRAVRNARRLHSRPRERRR